ncbi:MAG: DUF3365 domain-containing protein [Leptolyngbyaceae cyanobacterium RM1_406_9]|nr:DUF3365 domain-containing protein [Leptolyngbyaceae cyanobacterium RM1_406_9]
MQRIQLQLCFQWFISLSVVILSMIWYPAIAQAAPSTPNPTELSRAVQEIEYLDAMRSGLASSLEGRTEAPTLQTMKEVCRPVGMRAQELSRANDWQVKQVAKKYRNPDHAPDTLNARIALAKFEQDPNLIGFWDREAIAGQSGTRYYRRINVEASCLACHGLKDRRPQFVQENYPQDLAYDFKIGDLRGMYAVFMPDLQQALQISVSHQ